MRLITIVCLALSLSVSAIAQVRFADASAYKVDATSLSIVVEDQTPRDYPQVGHLAPTTFEQATRAWVAQRFQLTGNSVNSLRITLREGRITEKILPIEKGIRGWFKKEEAVAYEGALSVEIAIVDPAGSVLSKAEASAMMTRTLIEGATRADKEATRGDMIGKSFESVDREIKARLMESMSRYIN